MKLQKNIALISGVCSFFSLVFSWIGNCRDYTFISNVFMGLFSSSALVCGVAIITFYSEYTNRLHQLYCDCMDFSQVSPFGFTITCEKDFLIIKDKLNQAMSIYNKGILIAINELKSISKRSKLYIIVTKMDISARILNNSIIDLNEQIMLCVFQGRGLKEFFDNELIINQQETTDAMKDFVNAVNELVKYLNHNKTQKRR